MRAVCQKTGAGWLSYHLPAMAKTAAVSALLLAAFAGLAGAHHPTMFGMEQKDAEASYLAKLNVNVTARGSNDDF
jgi:hypothetical protein